MKRIVKLGAIVLALSGCATTPRPPVAVQVKTVEVVKAVPVPCVTPEEIPPRAAKVSPDPAKSDLARKVAGLYVDFKNLFNENEQLRALLVQCTQGGKP
jgi:hypothetical protein